MFSEEILYCSAKGRMPKQPSRIVKVLCMRKKGLNVLLRGTPATPLSMEHYSSLLWGTVWGQYRMRDKTGSPIFFLIQRSILSTDFPSIAGRRRTFTELEKSKYCHLNHQRTQSPRLLWKRGLDSSNVGEICNSQKFPVAAAAGTLKSKSQIIS